MKKLLPLLLLLLNGCVIARHSEWDPDKRVWRKDTLISFASRSTVQGFKSGKAGLAIESGGTEAQKELVESIAAGVVRGMAAAAK